MTNRLRHRGPDGWGVRMFPGGGIGHRRLSIIDLESGAQPLSNEDESVWITLSGEIYNYVELRGELRARGHRFRTDSDTEVVVHAYEEWAFDVLKKLRGMFSFAIVDTRQRFVFLARDHFGIKPLYYHVGDGLFAFASELQAFGVLRDFTAETDLGAIDEYLSLLYIPAPRTIWQKTFKLRAAHYVVYSFDGTLDEPAAYWDVDFSAKKRKSEEEWLEEADAVIGRSVQAHLVSEVPVGAFLSGGVDSTLVVSHMSKLVGGPVKTFSIGFEEEEFNELRYAREAAARLGTEHFEEIVRPDGVAILPELVRHYGEPFGDSSAIPTYYASRLARRHVTVSLSGDGGDEGFGGYRRYLDWMKHQTVHRRHGWKRALLPLAQAMFPRRYRRADPADEWMTYVGQFGGEERRRLWKKEYHEAFSPRPEEIERLMVQSRKLSPGNRVQWVDLHSYLPNDILTKVDVASMIHSLEVRTPLIDKEVWEFVATVPESFNLREAHEGGEWDGKVLLKKLVARQFAPAFVSRRKMGFRLPLKNWFAEGGALDTMLRDYLLSSDARVLHLFNGEALHDIVQKRRPDQLWPLLFLEEWIRATN